VSGPAGAALPRLDGVRPPQRLPLDSPLRQAAAWLLRRRYDLRVHGAHHVPRRGPVIVASNHIGLVDGPLLAIVGPRPVHALTKEELFTGRLGAFLTLAGQIRLDRRHPDPGAVKAALRTLADGRCVGVFPEGARGGGDFGRMHLGAAYLALVSGAPVVPLVVLGTREPGAGIDAVPPRGARLDLVYGAPLVLGAEPWPRTRARVREATEQLHRHLLAHLDDALALTGRSLPGPLPPGDHEPDPATGITD